MRRRIRIFREGYPTTDGRLLVPDVVHLPVTPIPLLRQGLSDGSSNVIGRVSGFQRRKYGWVYGLVDTGEDGVSVMGLAAQIDLDHIEHELMGGHLDLMVVTGGRLRAVTLGKHPAWKGMLS
jgi:hypothetical protein